MQTATEMTADKKRDVEKQEVLKMLKRKVIEPSNSVWSSPIVFVTKEDASVRFCVDYRRINDLTRLSDP